MAVMTQQEFEQKYGRAPSATPTTETNTPKEGKPIAGGLDAVFGGKQIGESLVSAGTNIGNLVTGGLDKFQKNYQSVDVPALIGDYTKAASNFIPGAGKGAGLATKTAAGAATGYAMDVGNKMKAGQEDAFTPGLGTALGAGIPVAGAVLSPAAKIVGSLFKGTGSALSGASQQHIEAMLADPRAAQEAADTIKNSGEQALVTNNARTIVNGIGSARRQARSVYGNALEGLAAEDIKPSIFRGQTQGFLDKYGISLKGSERTLDNVEFTDPKNLQKASDLIDKLANTELDGKSLRKLTDDIENAMYKTATSDERLSFNAFVQDMAKTVRGAIDKSTPKLAEMNAKFSKDMQLLEATQNIFGTVDYQNLPEVMKASQRLEGIFNQKGMAPTVIDDFLTRIGVDPGGFRASEAARQVGNIEQKANAPGINPLEMVRAVTSAVVSPKLVRDITIATGASEQAIKPFLEALSTPARNAVIQLLLQQESSQGGTEGETAPENQI